jgi:hypothetical protein
MRRIIIRKASAIVLFDEALRAQKTQKPAPKPVLDEVKKIVKESDMVAWLELIDFCLERTDLTRWEETFLDSIAARVDGGLGLTLKQEQILYRIHDRPELDGVHGYRGGRYDD